MTPPIDPARLARARQHCVAVVGGANTDIVGTSARPIVMHDSNPGHVSVSPGGVGRNNAENLARLGIETHLVTAFGGDGQAQRLQSSCVDAGIRVERSLLVRSLPGARYLAIHDESGDLSVAVSDMRVIDEIAPAELAEPDRRDLLERADIVVADANLPEESLLWLAENIDGPVVLDPVSTTKLARTARVVPRLAAFLPNRYEAEALLGCPVVDEQSARTAARDIVARGCARAFVTCGPLGVAWADAESAGFVPAPAVDIVNANGAGDAFTAGVVCGMVSGLSTAECAVLGTSLAALTLASEETVSRQVSLEAVVSLPEEQQ